MPKKIVLIDYENIQPHIETLVDDDDIHALIFVGAQQDRIPFSIADNIQKMGNRAEYVKIKGTADNALDFHIAYYIGLIADKFPDAQFYVISKDRGYDPLIAHLKERMINISRKEAISKIVTSKKSSILPSKIDIITDDLRRRSTSKPKTLKTLASTINAIFQGQLNTSEVDDLIAALKQKKYISIRDKNVSYNLPQK